jgi:hypothetical protein
MAYGVIAVFFVVLALLFLAMAAKLLLNRHWILGFIRGFAGFSAMAAVILLVLVAIGFSDFTSLSPNQTVMTLSFKRTSPEHFAGEIQTVDGHRAEFSVQGEQWQLDVRMLYWSPVFKAMGFPTGYQLEMIKGRYLAFDRQQHSNDKGTLLRDPPGVFDFWNIIVEGGVVPGMTGTVMTPGFIPIGDGAIYEIALSGTNLVVTPVNEAAKAAQSIW